MNIYTFELKRLFRTFITWTLGIVGVLVLMMSLMYPVMESAKDEVQEIFASFPPEMMKTFGIDMHVFFSYEGFYSFSFMYVGLVGAIMAVVVSINCVAREKQSKCEEFLFTKPVDKLSVYALKYLAGLSVIVLTNVVNVCVMSWLFSQNVDDFEFDRHFVLILLSLFLTQWVFFSIGTFYATFVKKIKFTSGVGVGIGIFSLMVYFLMQFTEKTWLRFICPTEYFAPSYVFADGSFDVGCVVVGVVVIALGSIFSAWKYGK